MWTRWSSSVSGSVSVLTWASCELTVSRILSSPWTRILGKGDTSCVDLPLQSLPAAAREMCCISYFSASSGRTPGKDRLYACARATVCPHPPRVSSRQRIPSADGVCPYAMGPCTQTRGGDPWVGGGGPGATALRCSERQQVLQFRVGVITVRSTARCPRGSPSGVSCHSGVCF